MKNLKYNIIIIALLATSSCSLLDENAQSALTEKQTYENVNMIRNNAVLSVYQHIGGINKSEGLQGTTYGIYDLNSITTDEQYIPVRGTDWYDGGHWLSLATHTWKATDKTLYDTWNYLYKVITLCTYNIHQIDSAKTYLPTDQPTLDAFIAELKALRAMYYFYTMDLFGNIPVITYSDIAQKTAQQWKRPDVYAYLVNELTDALPLLSEEYSQKENSAYYGRITRYVAYFMLAKLALNAAIYTDADWSDNDFPSAENFTFNCDGQQLNPMQAVVYYADLLSRAFSLEPDYTSNFAVNNHNSVENIFTIPINYMLYNRCYFYFHRSRHYSHGAALGVGGENGTCATLETLATFGYPDNIDPRFDYNFYYEYVVENGDTVYLDDGTTPLYYAPLEAKALDLSGSEYEKTAGARLRKYEFDTQALSDGTIGNNDIVLFRYADALLMKAESLVRQGLDGSAPFNEVRNRAGVAPIANVTLDEIYSERWRELMWEGWHRNDMIRFHLFSQPTNENAYNTGTVFYFKSVFPIPQKIIDMNPTWEQNYKY